MLISDKIAVQNILYLAKKHQIEDVVISPGSRNAPFILSFTNDDAFTCYQVVDERSAAFFAMGIALQKKKPVILSCTSGSAALNYAPAIVEAFHQNIPLLVLTSDRPSDGYQIGDGQCFNQVNIYNNYIKHQVNLIDQETDLSNASQPLIADAFDALYQSPLGPVHINVPFNEPLYTMVEGKNTEQEIFPIVEKDTVDASLLHDLTNKWHTFSRKLLLVSQGAPKDITNLLVELQKNDASVYVLQENTSNTNHQELNSCIDRTIKYLDNWEDYAPDLILTIGNNIISKIIKQDFRKHAPKEHWSFHNSLNQDIFKLTASHFSFPVKDLLASVIQNKQQISSTYQERWKARESRLKVNHNKLMEAIPYSDLKAFHLLWKYLPSCSLHLANSSVVRYAQLLDARTDIAYYANRGVSGIDGSTSTAVGYSINRKDLTVLITGDLSFFYDGNALWNSYKNNLLLVVINNGGGSIFKIIDGPTKLAYALPYFVANQPLSIQKYCDLHNVSYALARNENEITDYLSNFKQKNTVQVLEIDTKDCTNEQILNDYFKQLNP